VSGKEIICIVCPMGCHLEVTEDINNKDGYKVEGNKCPRGKEYGINEMVNPTRVLTTTIKINNAPLKRLPVKTDGVIPKTKIFECMEIINKVEVSAPINMGEVIIKDILGTGVDVVASRSMK
jgi:CxxC motif-containing protein